MEFYILVKHISTVIGAIGIDGERCSHGSLRVRHLAGAEAGGDECEWRYEMAETGHRCFRSCVVVTIRAKYAHELANAQCVSFGRRQTPNAAPTTVNCVAHCREVKQFCGFVVSLVTHRRRGNRRET